jgi:hypothetical protein
MAASSVASAVVVGKDNKGGGSHGVVVKKIVRALTQFE